MLITIQSLKERRRIAIYRQWMSRGGGNVSKQLSPDRLAKASFQKTRAVGINETPRHIPIGLTLSLL